MVALRPSDGWRPRGDVIVSGHSHSPRFVRHRSGVHFLNPGSAGPQRFKLPRQFAIVRCDADGGLDVSRIDLASGVSRAWVAKEEGDNTRGAMGSGSPTPAPPSTTARGGTSGRRRKRSETEPTIGASSGGGSGGSSRGGAGDGDEGSTLLGTVEGLFLKEKRGAPMASCEALELRMGVGIVGDVHASPLCPRQILLHGDVDRRGPPAGESSQAKSSQGPQAGAMRENIFLQLGAAWPPPSGSVLSVGERGAAVRVSFACEPCADGAAYAGVDLCELSRQWKARASRGMLATALRSGWVGVGDEVRLLACERYAPLGLEHPQRVRHILSKVPHGKVISWTLLAQLAGAPTGFSMRGMPGLLKRAAANGAPAWRVVDSKWRCPRNADGRLHLPDQYERLGAEGCRLSPDGDVVDREGTQWAPEHSELYWDAPE